jgi:hypothetical protein
MKTNVTPTVAAIGKMEFQGNITPTLWYKNITFESGKADLVAITILAEVVYWYRPKIVKDEATGDVIEYSKKFAADKLQRSYQSFADQFGISKRQARDACKRLSDQGLITLEFRTVKTKTGTKLGNVLYLEPVPDKLAEITYPPMTLERHRYDAGTSEVSRPNATGVTLERQTNTETTTQTTTDSNADAGFSEEQEQALEAMISQGVEQSQALDLAATCPPAGLLALAAEIKTKKGLTNPAGYLVAQARAGRWPTSPPIDDAERERQERHRKYKTIEGR